MSETVKTYVFRVNCEEDYIKRELEQGRLRQGWGWLGTDLNNAKEDEWIKTQCQRDPFPGNEKYYKIKFNNLSKMLEIKENDIIIIPKIPTSSQFTICKADGRYEFKDSVGYDGDDFRHVIPIKTESVLVCSYHANESSKNIHSIIGAYRSPVNNVWNEKIQNAVPKLLEEKPLGEAAELSKIIEEIKSDCLKNTLNRLRDLGNKDTEEIVALIFEKLGYVQIKRNSFDHNGGDADFIFADNSLSELLEASLNGPEIERRIYVQVKNKYGEDKGDIEGVTQLIKRTEDIANVTKILISTADKFTEDCKKLANHNNVLLIDSSGFLRLVFKYLD